MSDRSDEAGRYEPQVLIVPYRTNHRSAKLLPPILIVFVGITFLTYRARSADWRGISSFFEPRSAPRRELAVNTSPPIPPALDAAEKPAQAETVAADPAVEPKPEPSAAPPKKVEADPLDEIRLEAEKTKKRIAELEELKRRETQKLDDTADERERTERNERMNRRWARMAPVAPEQLEKMLRGHNEQLRLQMARMAEIQLQQMRQMAAMQREFFNDPGAMRHAPFGVLPPPPAPEFNAKPGRVRKLPVPGGIAQFQEFRGPGGMNGFRLEIRPRSSELDDDETPPPPPPRPRARQVD